MKKYFRINDNGIFGISGAGVEIIETYSTNTMTPVSGVENILLNVRDAILSIGIKDYIVFCLGFCSSPFVIRLSPFTFAALTLSFLVLIRILKRFLRNIPLKEV